MERDITVFGYIMLEHVSYHPDWAKVIEKEISVDTEDWFHPRGRPSGVGRGDFDLGRMRFLNRNLNYFYFENMVSHAVKNDYQFNSNYPNTLRFCETVRDTNNERGPFGRMCVWNLAGYHYLLPHIDGWEYHFHITRYIFCVSDHKDDDVVIKICDQRVPVKQGSLFSFFPAVEKHEFINKTNRDFHFIGFDYWNLEKLSEATIRTNITKDTEIFYEPGFGGRNKKTRYMSKE